MHETMRRSLKPSKIVHNDNTNQEMTTKRQGVMIKLGKKKNQTDDILAQNFNNKKPPALTPLSPKSWPNGELLPGTQLPPIFAQTRNKDEARTPLNVTRSIVNERKGASRSKCEPITQRSLDSGQVDANEEKTSHVPTIRLNGSEKVSLYTSKDRLSLVKSSAITEQGGLRKHRVKSDRRKQRENGNGCEIEYHQLNSPKPRRAYGSRSLDESVNDFVKEEVNRTRISESLVEVPHLYRQTQPPFHAPPLRAVLPPIGGLKPIVDKQQRKRDKKKAREAKRREKEKELKLKLMEGDLKLRSFFQSLAMNRRDATCVEVDKLLNDGMLVKFSESLVLLAAMQWWL